MALFSLAEHQSRDTEKKSRSPEEKSRETRKSRDPDHRDGVLPLRRVLGE